MIIKIRGVVKIDYSVIISRSQKIDALSNQGKCTEEEKSLLIDDLFTFLEYQNDINNLTIKSIIRKQRIINTSKYLDKIIIVILFGIIIYFMFGGIS